MTFAELVSEISDRLNITSTPGLTRIGRSINLRYRQMASSVGLQMIGRTVVTANTTPSSQSMTFANVQKIYGVFDTRTTPASPLQEITVNQMRGRIIGVDPMRAFAIVTSGNSTVGVTILLDVIPSTIVTLSADADAELATLSGSQIPAFAESYHDILVYGAMATELEKMEKYDMAKKQEAMYLMRLSELRYFLAKSAWLDIHQGKNAPTNVLTLLI